MFRNQTFISYQREDRETARRIRDALVARGVTIWWDEELQTGQRWSEIIDRALVSSSTILVLWSKNAVKSDWVNHEASIAKLRNVLAHVSIDGTPPPDLYQSIQFAPLAEWKGDSGASEVSELRRAITSIERKNNSRRISRYIGAGMVGSIVAAVIAFGGMWLQRYNEPLETKFANAWAIKPGYTSFGLANRAISARYLTNKTNLLFVCQNLGKKNGAKLDEARSEGNFVVRAALSKADDSWYRLLHPEVFPVHNGDKVACAIMAFHKDNHAVNAIIKLTTPDLAGAYEGEVRNNVSVKDNHAVNAIIKLTTPDLAGAYEGEVRNNVSVDELKALDVELLGKRGEVVCACEPVDCDSATGSPSSSIDGAMSRPAESAMEARQ